MSKAACYSVFETLRSGRQVRIRALKFEDREQLLAAAERVSTQSLFRRFFAVRLEFSEQEISFFTNVDFVNHIALIALIEESGRPVIVGGGRYIVVQPAQAELAFTVVDEYQGQGIGAILLSHLIAIAREAGIQELIAEVLPDNVAMLKVLEKSGLRLGIKRESGVVHVSLQLS